MSFLQELEPTVGAELCKLWDKDPSGSMAHHSRPSMGSNRRGQHPTPTQQDHHPSHWQQQSQPPLTTTPQMYTPHAASMPIPVPVPSQHSHGTVMQGFPHQVMGGVNQSPIGYTAHPVATIHPTNIAPVRYPANTSVIAGLQFQQQAPTGSAVLRPNSYSS